MCFVGNLILNMRCEFDCHDVITMTSLSLWIQSVSAKYFTHQYFSNSPSVEQHCELWEYEKSSTNRSFFNVRQCSV